MDGSVAAEAPGGRSVRFAVPPPQKRSVRFRPISAALNRSVARQPRLGSGRLFRAAGGRVYFNTEKEGEGHGGPRSRAPHGASLPPARCLSCPLPLASAMASHREAPHQEASHRGASWRRTRPKRRDTLRGPPWPSPSSSVVKNETDRAPEAPASGHPGARPAPPRRPALPRPGDRPCAGGARSRAAGGAARRDVSPARLTRS